MPIDPTKGPESTFLWEDFRPDALSTPGYFEHVIDHLRPYAGRGCVVCQMEAKHAKVMEEKDREIAILQEKIVMLRGTLDFRFLDL